MTSKLRLLAILATVVGIGCTSNGTTGVTALATSYVGVMTGATETGVVAISIAAAGSSESFGPSAATTANATASQVVTGTIKFGSATAIIVTGTYNSGTGVFTITGGGYTLTGTLASGVISGSYTGASTSGGFTLQQGSASAVTVYCGTYAGSSSGKWNLVEGSGGKLTGNAGPGAPLVGTRTGNSITLTYTGGTATGTVSGTTVTGTWAASPQSGTWTGSTAGCSN